MVFSNEHVMYDDERGYPVCISTTYRLFLIDVKLPFNERYKVKCEHYEDWSTPIDDRYSDTYKNISNHVSRCIFDRTFGENANRDVNLSFCYGVNDLMKLIFVSFIDSIAENKN